MALIGIALLAIFKLQGQNLALQSEARFITVARFLAQDRLASIQARSPIDVGSDNGDFGELFPGYYYEEELKAVEEVENLYEVRVSIFSDKEKRAGSVFEIRGLLYAVQE